MSKDISFLVIPSTSIPSYRNDDIVKEVRKNSYFKINQNDLYFYYKPVAYITKIYGIFVGCGQVILYATIYKPGETAIELSSLPVMVTSGNRGTPVEIIPLSESFQIIPGTIISFKAITTGTAQWYGSYNASVILVLYP